jgi:DNA-directed RNA polymerase subunit M/transcription elongation factor TFIIS
MRFAFWNFDINHLDTDKILQWSITEVAFYSEIYSDNWEDHFNKSIVKRYHEVIQDDSDPIFGLSICPECGNKELEKSSATDYSRDEEYYFIKCSKCGWNDWTQ